MAVAVTNPAEGGYASADYTDGPYKAKVRTITFDNSYPTAGESVTAAQVGLSQIVSVRPFVAKNAAGTLAYMGYQGVVNAAGTSVTLILAASGANAGDPLPEETAAADASLFSARVTFLGH